MRFGRLGFPTTLIPKSVLCINELLIYMNMYVCKINVTKITNVV